MIHTYTYNDNNIVIDTYSGAIHILDDLGRYAVERMDMPEFDLAAPEHWAALRAEMIDHFKGIDTPDAVDEVLTGLRELIDNETLFTEDTYRHLTLDLKKRPTYVKALCLNVAHTCNLDCDYCFASQGKYHGDRALMSFDVARRAIDFLIEHSKHHRNLDIDFFGGEPMMNWEVVKRTVEYARAIEAEHDKHFRFTFTTNGMLLNDEVTAFLNEHMHNVVLSLDGRRDVHDRLRHTVSGKGSYDVIVPKFQRFVEQRGDMEYYVRGTYTKNNLDFTADIFHMADLGFHRISMEPVIGDPSEPYMLSMDDVPVLMHQYERLANDMIRRNRAAYAAEKAGRRVSDLPPSDQPYVFYHFMLDLENGPCIHKRISGCGSGTEYMAVTPWGDLYPCHQFVGEDAYAIGNVFEGIKNTELISEFKSCNCYARQDCQACWAKLYCSGGCSANALHASGALTGTVPLSCELFRKRVECAIAIEVAKLEQEMEG